MKPAYGKRSPDSSQDIAFIGGNRRGIGGNRRSGLFSTKPPTFLVRFSCNGAILEEMPELLERERLAGVDQRLGGLGVDVGEDQVRAGDDALRGDVEDVLQAVGSGGANAD